MNTSDLKIGNEYYYNGNSILIKVKYNGYTKEGYKFTEKGRNGTIAHLTAKEVKEFIES